MNRHLLSGLALLALAVGAHSAQAQEGVYFGVAGGGAGVNFPVGSDSKIFFEARYISVFTETFNTAFIPLTLGITFGVN